MKLSKFAFDMELKRYQRRVLRDIEAFIDLCNEKRNIPEAYRSFWHGKGIELEEQTELHPYRSSIPGVPSGRQDFHSLQCARKDVLGP